MTISDERVSAASGFMDSPFRRGRLWARSTSGSSACPLGLALAALSCAPLYAVSRA